MLTKLQIEYTSDKEIIRRKKNYKTEANFKNHKIFNVHACNDGIKIQEAKWTKLQ